MLKRWPKPGKLKTQSLADEPRLCFTAMELNAEEMTTARKQAQQQLDAAAWQLPIPNGAVAALQLQ